MYIVGYGIEDAKLTVFKLLTPNTVTFSLQCTGQEWRQREREREGGAVIDSGKSPLSGPREEGGSGRLIEINMTAPGGSTGDGSVRARLGECGNVSVLFGKGGDTQSPAARGPCRNNHFLCPASKTTSIFHSYF